MVYDVLKTRRGFFKSLLSLAATVALAPRIAFGVVEEKLIDCGTIEGYPAQILSQDELRRIFTNVFFWGVPVPDDTKELAPFEVRACEYRTKSLYDLLSEVRHEPKT